MKKHLTFLALALLLVQGVMAQTMKVYTGQIVTLIPSATASDMIFENDGTSFKVMGNTFRTEAVDRILFDRTEVQPNTLSVDYAENGATVTVSGDVASRLQIRAERGHVSVCAAPSLLSEVHYILRGTSTNGSFFMDGEYKARLTLDNLTLTNPDSAAINIANGKRIDVNLPAGTTSRLADGQSGMQKACFFINGHAEFKGAGSLELKGNARHAYASDEYTVLKAGFGTLRVTAAASDGLHIEQYFKMDGGNVEISGTKGDGVDVGITNNPADEFNGEAFIHGGTLKCKVAADDTKGLKTDRKLTLTGGDITMQVTGAGTKGISAGSDLLISSPELTTPFIQMTVSGGTYRPDDPLLKSKCRGIKVKGNFTFDGGKIRMEVTNGSAKGISVDGQTVYKKGDTNVMPS